MDLFLLELVKNPDQLRRYAVQRNKTRNTYKVPWNNGWVVVKRPTKYSDYYSFLRNTILQDISVSGFCFGDSTHFPSSKVLLSEERKKLKLLEEKGFPAPRVIDSLLDDLIVLEYVEGESVRGVLRREGTVNSNVGGIIAAGTQQLYDLHHKIGLWHGDTNISNGIIKGSGKYIWVDYGTILNTQKRSIEFIMARDLRIYLHDVSSVVGNPKECVGLVSEVYPSREILNFAYMQIADARMRWIYEGKEAVLHGRNPLILREIAEALKGI